MHSVWIAKTYLTFCRVNVYIDCGWVEIDKKKSDRELSFNERGVIALEESVSNEAAFDSAAVHKNELLGARLPTQPGLPNEAADLNFR